MRLTDEQRQLIEDEIASGNPDTAYARALRAALARCDEADAMEADRSELIELVRGALALLKPGVTQPHRNIGWGMLAGNLEAITTEATDGD